jgi:hypothetical protein
MGLNSSGEGIANMSLSTASCAVKEKVFSFSIVNGIQDLVKSVLLLWIKVGIDIVNIPCHFLPIISKLLIEKWVGSQLVPLLLRKKHVGVVREGLFSLYEDDLDEVKTVVEDIFIYGIQTAKVGRRSSHSFSLFKSHRI